MKNRLEDDEPERNRIRGRGIMNDEWEKSGAVSRIKCGKESEIEADEWRISRNGKKTRKQHRNRG